MGFHAGPEPCSAESSEATQKSLIGVAEGKHLPLRAKGRAVQEIRSDQEESKEQKQLVKDTDIEQQIKEIPGKEKKNTHEDKEHEGHEIAKAWGRTTGRASE